MSKELLKLGSRLRSVFAVGAVLAAGCSGEHAESLNSTQQELTRALPYRVRALDFTAFKDSDTLHEGNCGSGPVDSETTTDPNGGGCNVGWSKAGEWLDYSIQVASTKKFNIVARLASGLTGKTVRISIDGVAVGGSLTAPSAGWQAFADRAISDVTLSAGTHTVRVLFETGDTNFNYLDITPGTATLPARIEAEDYQRAFESTPASNSGNGCERGDGVDKQTTADTTGGCNIGWTTAGEWLEYDVSAPQAGLYDFLARLGSGVTGRTIQINVDGASVGTLSSPSTGFALFEDRKLDSVSLSAGAHVVRVLFVQGDTNLNYLDITAHATTVPSTGYSLGAAVNYNVFVFQDLSVTPTIAGPAAAGRDITAQSFGYDTSSVGTIGALVGRNFTGANGSVHRDLVYGGALSLSNVGVIQGVSRKATPVDFNAEKATLSSTSANLAKLTPNGTTTVYANGTSIDFAGVDPIRDVFKVDGALLGITDVLRFLVPASATVIVNVTGPAPVFETTGMQLGGVPPGHVLWNFPQATTLRFAQTGFKGTLLAVNAAVTQSSSTLDGVLIANSLTGGDNGLTWLPFNGSLPVPTPLCVSKDDTDGDGIADCNEACPYDPLKTEPGACNCGTPDIDKDTDGTPDCLEHCDLDKNNTNPGECGCVGQKTLKPANTPCSDTGCPVTGAVMSTCDGAGVCGNRSGCDPSPIATPGICNFVNFQGTSYWVCSTGSPTLLQDGTILQPKGQLTETQAQLACTAKGLTLSRINTLAEERFFSRIIRSPMWLGANDLTATNTWRWSAPNSNDGDQFWAGDATGKALPGRFAFWAAGSPGAQRCATIRPGDGRWLDTNCNEKHGFMCQYAAPYTGPNFPDPNGSGGAGGGGGGGLAQPKPLSPLCVPQAQSKLPATYAELQSDYAKADAGIYVGAAANPPPAGTTCDQPNPNSEGIGLNPTLGGGCEAVNVQKGFTCSLDSDCSALGSDYKCRVYNDVLACKTPTLDAGQLPAIGAGCKGHHFCMQVRCPTTAAPCDEIDICDPGLVYDGGKDPGTNLDAGTYDPATAFGGALPDAGSVGIYNDPILDTGTAHSWCSMNAQHGVTPAHQPERQYKGQGGKDSKLQFDFNPDLDFDVKPNPLALGESNTLIRAKAKLGASVTLHDFLTVNFTQPILLASAGIVVDRCSVDTTTETSFQVFGFDFIPLELLGIPAINTNSGNSSVAPVTRACRAGLASFGVAADRAKKSFRDAQQLLSQYWTAQGANKTLSANLCTQLGVDTAKVPNFPGGNVCPTGEPVETTINRFIDYYQKDGTGQLTRLRQAASGLALATKGLRDALFNELDPTVSLQFADTHGDESQTVVNAPFAIGPIPMVLQIDVFASYGITGNFDLGLDFPVTLESPVAEAQPVAHVKASVVPYAVAGLSAFVGAGFDLGPLKATVGIEGQLTLADVRAPIFVGAGIDVAVQQDLRPLPTELLPPVSIAEDAFQFGIPKSFKFYAGYNYGAGVDLVNVLSGTLNGRLSIRFFFFSRTWRKRIVQFNGWSFHYNLIQGGSNAKAGTVGDATAPETEATNAAANRQTTQVASGAAPQGLGEAQVPLMQLRSLNVPMTKFTTTVNFDATKVESMFYDSLCCLKAGLTCSPNQRPECCPGETCKVPPPDPDAGLYLDVGTCVTDCKKLGVACGAGDVCCQDNPAKPTAAYCGAQNVCRVCSDTAVCSEDKDCCLGKCDKSGTIAKCVVPTEVPK